MHSHAKASERFGFDANLMWRFWTLEGDFLVSFDQSDADLSVWRNRLLLSAIMFGGLLNAATWPGWIATVMGRLRKLSDGDCLPVSQTRSVYIQQAGQFWFADPLTQNLLGRRVNLCGQHLSTGGDFARLIRLSEDALIAELKDWVLPAAKAKMTLLWPPLVVEHCAGALKSQSLTPAYWDRLELSEAMASPAASQAAPLETIRIERVVSNVTAQRNFYMKDKGFSFIVDAIARAIQAYANSDDPKLELERKKLATELKASLMRHDEAPSYVDYPEGYECDEHNNLGWWVYEWFLDYCPAKPRSKDRKPPKPKRARTLRAYAVALGLRVDWADLWHTPLGEISPAAMETKLHAVARNHLDGFEIAKRLYSFLGFGKLAKPADLELYWETARRAVGIKSQILSRPEYDATLAQLHDTSGGRGAHWLAAMLMFRCGLRTREIIALEIDHITVVGDIVELKVRATPYVELKNDTSKRTLPLHALLAGDELAELLRWRAQRIRDCQGKRSNARLLFATAYHESDYDWLCDPIEAAIRSACGQRLPSAERRKSPAYIFSRCSVLRHSFVSYAVTTMLLPRDDGGFELPTGITPDLVSLARRERLERALLAQGHLGLSSLEAVRQLTGHAKFTRTLETYTHLLDLIAGAYSWRRSSEPALPAEVVCALSPQALKADTLSHYARKAGGIEEAAFASVVEALKRGDEASYVVLPRERRTRGQRFPDWMPRGNAFLSQLRRPPLPPAPEADDVLPEWRSPEASDWRTLDQIVQMASRAVPARLISDEVGVQLTFVERLAERYLQLLSLRRRTTANAGGQYRHQLLLKDPSDFIDIFDTDHGCWYGSLSPMPSQGQERIDRIWAQLQVRRQDPKQLEKMRDFLSRHQDGQLLLKRTAPLDAMAKAFAGLLSDERSRPSDVVVKQLKKKETSKPSDSIERDAYLLYFKGQFERLKDHKTDTERWEPARVLLHLLLLAEAASPGALPDALVTTPVVAGQTNVGAKIKEDVERAAKLAKERRKEKLKRQQRAERSAERAKDEAAQQKKQAVQKAAKDRRNAAINRIKQHARGQRTFAVETRSAMKPIKDS